MPSRVPWFLVDHEHHALPSLRTSRMRWLHWGPLPQASQLIMRLILVLLIATAAAAAATCTVVLRYNWRADALNFLVLLLDLFRVCLWIRVQPRLTILEGIHNLLLFLFVELLAQTLVLA